MFFPGYNSSYSLLLVHLSYYVWLASCSLYTKLPERYLNNAHKGLSMAINCPRYVDDRKKKPFDASERSDISRRIALENRILRAASQTPMAKGKQAAFNLQRVQAQSTWIRYLADLQKLTPENTPRMLDKLVTEFGLMNKKLGLDPNAGYTIAGEVRENLLDAKRTIEGLIATAGRISVLERVQPFTKKFNAAAKKLGVNSDETAALLDDIITVGQIPRTQSSTVYYKHKVLGRQTLSSVIQRKRYNRLVDALESVGFTKPEIDSFINEATVVNNAFDDVAVFARAVGVDVKSLENIGFFSRQVTQSFKNRLGDLNIDDLLSKVNLGNTTMSSVHNRSRNTFHYIPEDLEFSSRILGIQPTELNALLDDPIVLRSYLHDNLSTQQLDTLVDAGVFQKLPMSSREVHEYFLRQYELPLSVNDMFVLDPVTNIKNYTQSLQRAAGNSSILQRVLGGEGVVAGWTVPSVQFLENGGKTGIYRNFVPLGDSLNAWGNKSKLMTTTAVEEALGLEPGSVRKLSDMYVHPIVAEQFTSLIEMAASPSNMGQVANVVQNSLNALGHLSNKLTKAVLATPQYVFRTVMQNSVAYHAAGGNLAYLPVGLLDLQKLVTKGLGAFDNTTPRFSMNGKMMTYRELFETFLVKRGHNVAPGTNLERLTLGSEGIDGMWEFIMNTPKSVTKGLNDLIGYTMAHGDPVNGRKISMGERVGRFSKVAAQSANQLLDDSFSGFAFAANFFDLTFKWAMTLSTAQRASGQGASNIGQFLSSQQVRNFTNTDALFRHMDQYFVDVYATGATTNFVNKHIFPFTVWAMANPPMQFRHMFRNPHTFLNYHRIRSLVNIPLENDENFNDEKVDSWLLEGSPLFLTRDEQGRPVVLLTDNYDSYSDTISFVNGVGNTVYRSFGGEAEFDEQRRQDLTEGPGALVSEIMLDVVSKAHLPWKVIVEQITGRDSFTGRDFTLDESEVHPTYLGIQIPPRMVYLLNKIPPLEALDQLNPGEMFGTPRRRSIDGTVLDVGTLSVFGTDRTRIRSKDYDVLDQNFALQLLRASGLNIKTVDYDRGAINTLSDIERTARTIERHLADSRRTLTEERIGERTISDSERQRLLDYRDEQINAWFQLRMDHERILAWATDNGVTSHRALRELDDLRIKVRGLPDPNQDTINKLLLDALEFRLQDNQ